MAAPSAKCLHSSCPKPVAFCHDFRTFGLSPLSSAHWPAEDLCPGRWPDRAVEDGEGEEGNGAGGLRPDCSSDE